MQLQARLPILTLLALTCGAALADNEPEQPLIVLDEDVWVTFYDLPSRRFRSIRDAFLRRDFDTVSRDLDTTISFLQVESDRSVAELTPAFESILSKMGVIRSNLADPTVTIAQFDVVFARTHWLLSQHYFVSAQQSRELGLHRNAGRYLSATAHHLERAVLWSNARISRDIVNSLESIRNMAARLQRGEAPDKVYRDKPLKLTSRTLIAVGEHIDRELRIEELLPE